MRKYGYTEASAKKKSLNENFMLDIDTVSVFCVRTRNTSKKHSIMCVCFYGANTKSSRIYTIV